MPPRSLTGLGCASLADYFAKIEGTPAKDEKVPSLWAFPAALALVRIGQVHHSMKGLAGATNWRSIALQHIATTELTDRAAAKKCLLGQAFDLDPANDGAALAYWQTIYPRSKDVTELTAYSEMLTSLIERHDAEAADDAALVLRARFSLTATLVNLGYSTIPPDNGAPARRAWDDLAKLRNSVEESDGPAAELAKTMRPRVEAMEASAGGRTAEPSRTERASTRLTTARTMWAMAQPAACLRISA